MMAAVADPVVSDQEVVAELRAAWAEISRAYARYWAAMAEVAQRTSPQWETAEIAAALTFTRRRAEGELGCAQVLVHHLPRVHAALAAGELDHPKARVFTDYLINVTLAQAERICERLVPKAVEWTTSQLAARLLREVQAIDPGYTRRIYEQAVRGRAVSGYLDHTGTAVLSGSGLPAAEAAAAAARLEALADELRSTGYPATLNQTRADLFLRLLDGTLDGLTSPQIVSTMLELGPLAPSDSDPTPEQHRQPFWARGESGRGEPEHQPPHHAPTEGPTPLARPAPAEYPTPPKHTASAEQPTPTEHSAPVGQPAPVEDSTLDGQPEPGEHAEGPERAPRPSPGLSPQTTTPRRLRYGIEVWVRLSTLLGLDEHPAELPGWGPISAAAARDVVAAQHHAEWRIAVVDSEGYLLHGNLTRRRPTGADTRGECRDGIVEISLPESMLDHLPTLATEHPQWARVLHGILASWTHRHHARAALDAHPHRRFAHKALRRHVQMRDRYCVGIRCRHRATATELDHTRDHAHGGPTLTTNSGPCCARDHLMKHQGGWRLTQPEAGHFIWISPLGQRYHTRGEPLIPDLPPAVPRDLTPDQGGLPLMDEGPILHQPEPPPPPTRPPPAHELPDEPPF